MLAYWLNQSAADKSVDQNILVIAMTKSALLLFLCISVLVSVVVGVSKRSARWDAHVDHVHHLHNKRQAPNQPGCNWQAGKDTNCTLSLSEIRANDALGRRATGLLAPVGNQGTCGSCWAFAAAHTFADARSLQAGSTTLPLSTQHPASCRLDGNGCCGGTAHNALVFFGTNGAVTETCAPYNTLLLKYTYNKIVSPFDSSISDTCPTTCADGSPLDPLNIRLPSISDITDNNDVLTALSNGPVAARMRISTAFISLYRCGIFCHVPGDDLKMGTHSVEIVDYGSENGVDFWVIKNSWGTKSGEDGYFRMRRGDLTFGKFTVPDLSGQGSIRSLDTTADYTCSPNEVANPGSNELVMSAVEHALEEINERRGIPCPNGGQASSVVFNSIVEATSQVVDGIVIVAEFMVDILGCGVAARATICSTVVVQDDNIFSLTSYTYEYSSGGNVQPGGGNVPTGGGNVLTGSVAMVTGVIAVLLLYV